MNVAGISLLHGMLVPAIEVAAGTAMVVAVRWRDSRRSMRWLVIGGAAGTGTAVAVYWTLAHQGLLPDDAPWSLWVWITLTVCAVVVAVTGWTRLRWGRRAAALLAAVLAVLCIGLSVNQWSGFYPSTGRAWQGLTGQALTNEAPLWSLTALRNIPEPDGKIIPIRIPSSVSHFRHRTEYAYLPPTWFVGPAPPTLPVVVMIGGVITTPEDWVRSGGAVSSVQNFAATHHGQSPILVFIDPTGGLTNDTECVNGTHGNVDTHITQEVRPFVISSFGAASDPARWSVAGWSMGGTCAVDLTVEHPDLFHTFVDISGDPGPNIGGRNHTITALYGGHADQWSRFDPATAMNRHGHYENLAGWFQAEGHRMRDHQLTSPQVRAAQTLDTVAHANNITTVFRAQPGKHTWSFAANAFAQSLPWLNARLFS